jgi:hypothetical protein
MHKSEIKAKQRSEKFHPDHTYWEHALSYVRNWSERVLTARNAAILCIVISMTVLFILALSV